MVVAPVNCYEVVAKWPIDASCAGTESKWLAPAKDRSIYIQSYAVIIACGNSYPVVATWGIAELTELVVQL